MEKNKVTLLTIVLLLLIFVPCTIVGMNKHFEEKNKTHDFHYNGSLYFYNNDILIGTYKCKTDNCDYAYYNIIGTEEQKQTNLINNQYAFIKDGNKIYLEDIKNGWSINEYEEIVSYNIPIENTSYITKNNNSWGIISMSPTLTPYLINKYDEINIKHNEEDKIINLETIYVKEQDEYKIIKNKEELFSSSSKIIDSNDNIVVNVLDDDTFKIVDYENKDLFENETIVKYKLTANYLIIWTNYNLQLHSINKEGEILNFVSSYDAYADVKIEANKLNVYEYEEIIDSFEL